MRRIAFVLAALMPACASAPVDEVSLDKALDVFPSCKSPPEACRKLIDDSFDEPLPGLPPASVGRLRFTSGEKTGEVFLWVYKGDLGSGTRMSLPE